MSRLPCVFPPAQVGRDNLAPRRKTPWWSLLLRSRHPRCKFSAVIKIGLLVLTLYTWKDGTTRSLGRSGYPFLCTCVLPLKMVSSINALKDGVFLMSIGNELYWYSRTLKQDQIFFNICSTGMSSVKVWVSCWILMNLHPSLQFISTVSELELPFLDFKLRINGDKIQISVHYKETDTHSYLRYSSIHPDHCKRAIPYSQFLRLRRIPSDADFMSRAIDDKTLPGWWLPW